MSRTNDRLPAPPELPSYRVEEDAPRESPARPPRDDRHRGTSIVRHDARFDPQNIDADAAKVVHRLERAGFQAYLVGGCVRDMLLGIKPKDFDVATSARPEDVRHLFRNCRIIGRRFRLAHVLFPGNKVIEVATFRKNPQDLVQENGGEAEWQDDDLLIRNDNVFGEAHEDALRRDFTINALFYDLERHQILDWCKGLRDIEGRSIRTIGEPSVRFREDPIRILRAIKFAARLDLGLDPQLYDAMVFHRDELAKAARPRIFEEILRLLRGGAAHRSMWLLWESGAMAVLLPELAALLDDDDERGTNAHRIFRRLDAVDRMTKERGAPPDDVVLCTALLREPIEEAITGVRGQDEALADFLEPIVARVALTRRIVDAMRRVISVQARLESGRVGRMGRTETATLALDVLEVERRARGADTTLVTRLREALPPPEPAPPRREGREGGREGGRRRGRR
jgi:poly(A) polymerase